MNKITKRNLNLKSSLASRLLLCAAVTSLLGGCASNSSQTADASVSSQTSTLSSALSTQTDEQTIVLKDDLGREVEIQKPERAAILIGSFADLFADAGGKDQIAAAAHDTWTSFDLDLDSEKVQDLGDVKSIAQETLLSSDPDLVIASAKNDSQKKMTDLLEESGIPVVYYDVSSFEDYLRVLEQFCRITGDTSSYEKNGLEQQKRIEAIRNKERNNPPKVLALRETGKGIKALGSSNSVLGSMLADLKTENIAGEDGLDTLSMEVIAKENPDQIFYVAQGKTNEQAQEMADALFQSDAWKNLDAVKNGKVYVLDQKLYNLKPNAKWADALENLETIVYGE